MSDAFGKELEALLTDEVAERLFSGLEPERMKELLRDFEALPAAAETPEDFGKGMAERLALLERLFLDAEAKGEEGKGARLRRL